MDLRFDGKTVVLTGGASGIGRAAVQEFCSAGAAVVFTGTGKEPGAAKDFPPNSHYYRLDVTDEGKVMRFAEHVQSTYGGADILVNNAGIFSSGILHECTLAEWNKIFSVNVTGTFLCSKYFIPQMLEKGAGAIINTCSIGGLQGDNCTAAYNAAEGAIANLTRNMAIDYAPRGIRVNAVNPGLTKSPMYDSIAAEVGGTDVLDHGVADVYPLGRPAEAGEVAAAIVFLASEEANFVVGHNLVVDGGLTCWTGAQYKWDRVRREYEEMNGGVGHES